MRHSELYRPRRPEFRTAKAWQRAFDAELARAEAEATRALVVSHGQCLDGVGAAVVALRALGPKEVGVVYVQPDQVASTLEAVQRFPGRGRRLLVADLSFDPAHFDRVVDACQVLAASGWRIEWRDHHHKQWEGLDLARLEDAVAVLEVNDDATESGASLVQKALAPDDPFSRRFADTIKDRDLWRNETPDSETLEYAITWMETEEFTRHFVGKGSDDLVVDETVRRAAELQRRLTADHSRVLLAEARRFDAEGEAPDGPVAVVYGWLPKNTGLHELLQRLGVRVAINVRPNGKASLRSDPDAPVCHLAARGFSGGGHPHASGCDLGLRGLAYRWYVLRRGGVPRVAELATAAARELAALERA